MGWNSSPVFCRGRHLPKKEDTSPHYTIPMVNEIIEFLLKKVNKLFTKTLDFSKMNK